ncbi:MAG: hypothetical protein OEZ48_00510 [Candidatus Bathyarchaeota archaeon]|nr:hypothetical protein [Candidatus Bathyarchaeota archaeon]
MREEEECEPGCYRHIYFLHICEGKIMRGECRRLDPDEAEEFTDRTGF